MSKKKNEEAEILPVKAKGKGRPTPTRKEAEAARRRPLVPADRKAAKKLARQRRNEQWEREQEAMRTGDEAHMPENHRGPVRRWARDYVDARFSLGELFFPLALLIFLVLFINMLAPKLAAIVTFALYGLIVCMLIDAVLMTRRLRKKAVEKFGEDRIPGGLRWQMLGRAFYLRRWRRPTPQVARGEWPAGAK